ncbi:MAG: long-chain fatty acid--CoA ligase, partial [Candidatus Electrothrix sp. EH2]|nr:long-chain fatty acid--CoA ligase [Candidatus Electrothrix sp. EH2]
RKLLYRKIGRKLHHFFGGRLEIMGLGGAALNPEVEQFLRDAEFPFLVGYGLSEAAPLISGGPEGDSSILAGSAGKPVPGVEVRINKPDPSSGIGEIFARGPNIMQGYWNNPQASQEALTEDGWLRTGDLGSMDAQGNLCVRGRSKSVIVLSNGENIYPEAVEQKLNSYPLVLDSLVIENDSLLEAWIYPDYDLLAEQAQGEQRDDRKDNLTTELERIRKNVNRRLAPASRLTAVFVQQEPFVQTATHKIKRYLYTAEKLRSSSEEG